MDSSVSRGNVAAAEEPEYLARYFVVKHSWRGRYKRILCISNAGIVTLDPNTLAITNSYETGSNFDGALPLIGRDDNADTVGGEFTISVRTDGKGKFKAMKFSSRYRASILTELYRLRWSLIRPVAEFQVLHLRRRNAEWVPYVSTLPEWFRTRPLAVQHSLKLQLFVKKLPSFFLLFQSLSFCY